MKHLYSALSLYSHNFSLLLAEIAPYFLFGLFMAGFIKVYLPSQQLTKHLGGPGWKSIFKAALVGIPLPLCSCGVLPVALSLYRQGASLPATLSFLVSTPQTGLDAILISWGIFGGVFTFAYVLAALGGGLFTGTMAYLFLGTSSTQKSSAT